MAPTVDNLLYSAHPSLWKLKTKLILHPHATHHCRSHHGLASAGPYVNYNFRMIDAGSKESLMDLERRRRESSTSSVFNMEHGAAREAAASARGQPTRWLEFFNFFNFSFKIRREAQQPTNFKILSNTRESSEGALGAIRQATALAWKPLLSTTFQCTPMLQLKSSTCDHLWSSVNMNGHSVWY